MSQRAKVINMLEKAKSILKQAEQENLPLWATNDIHEEVKHLDEIVAALIKLK